jgi:hypothetical protein
MSRVRRSSSAVNRVQPQALEFDLLEQAHNLTKANNDVSKALVSTRVKFDGSTTPSEFLNHYELHMALQTFDRRIWALQLKDSLHAKYASNALHIMTVCKDILDMRSLAAFDGLSQQANEVWEIVKKEFLTQFRANIDSLKAVQKVTEAKQESNQRVVEFSNLWQSLCRLAGWNIEDAGHKQMFVSKLLPNIRSQMSSLEIQGKFSYAEDSFNIISNLAASFCMLNLDYKRKSSSGSMYCSYCPHLSNHTTEQCRKNSNIKNTFKRPRLGHSNSQNKFNSPPGSETISKKYCKIHNSSTHDTEECREFKKPKPSSSSSSAEESKSSSLTPSDPKWKCKVCKKSAPGHLPHQCPDISKETKA